MSPKQEQEGKEELAVGGSWGCSVCTAQRFSLHSPQISPVLLWSGVVSGQVGQIHLDPEVLCLEKPCPQAQESCMCAHPCLLGILNPHSSALLTDIIPAS